MPRALKRARSRPDLHLANHLRLNALRKEAGLAPCTSRTFSSGKLRDALASQYRPEAASPGRAANGVAAAAQLPALAAGRPLPIQRSMSDGAL